MARCWVCGQSDGLCSSSTMLCREHESKAVATLIADREGRTTKEAIQALEMGASLCNKGFIIDAQVLGVAEVFINTMYSDGRSEFSGNLWI